MAIVLCLAHSLCAFSQNIELSGKVCDENGAGLENVVVDAVTSITFTLTDKNGDFYISLPASRNKQGVELVFTLDGYESRTVLFKEYRNIKVTLYKEGQKKDVNIPFMFGSQKESLNTSAVSYVSGNALQQTASVSLKAALSGKLLGCLTIQEIGAPYASTADVYLRGRRSWQNRNPLLFVDGHRRDFDLIDPHEVDYVVAYKDAASLSLFGLRGGNGALMVTTKRGQIGRPVFKFNAQVSLSSPTQMPDYLDSYHYAILHNEAQLNDDPTATPIYSEEDLEHYRTGDSPYTHPNVDWIDETLKDFTINQRYNMSLEGGSRAARYFVNVSYGNYEGLYKTDKSVNTYNTNAGMQTYSVRSNVDISITNHTTLSIDLYGRQRVQNNPGSTTSAVAFFNVLYSMPSNIFPVKYGKDQVAGTNEHRYNPYGVLNYSGYSKYIHSTVETSAKLREDMSYITEGLSAYASFAFDARFDNTINRSKSYKVYEYDGVDETTGELILKQWGEESKQNNSNSFGSKVIRIFDIEAGLNYERCFASKHDVAAALIYNYNEESYDNVDLPNYHQGVFGKLMYAYDKRYIAQFTFGYQGTEQLPPAGRYGFFPAASVGWVLSNEPFIKNSSFADVLSTMKFRASYGLAGNDDGIPYYYYLPSFKQNSASRYNFGTTGVNVPGWVEDGLFNQSVTYEKSLKLNLGVDYGFFNDRLSGEFNWFDEKTSQILTTRTSVSTLLGMGSGSGPLGNVGRTTNKGYEISAGWSDKIRDFHYTFGGMFTYSHNVIDFNDEQTYAYSYRQTVGNSINDIYGYDTNGLYIDEQDMLNSPSTTFGTAYPGDIKYRDLNGDGVVDVNDQKRIGHNNLADKIFSFYLGADWKGFDFRVEFSGVADRNYYLKTTDALGILAFTNTSGSGGKYDGNVMQYHWDNRYNPNDSSTWTTATYPRLSLAGRSHNVQQSSFWLEDGTFLRLKNLEFGYTIPKKLTQKWHISRARVFYSGYNLFTWHRMRTLDPESTPNANNYPVQKVSSFGVNIEF